MKTSKNPCRSALSRAFLVVAAACFGSLGPASASASAAPAGEGLSLVFVGNSITRHGPAPTIHWTGNWGMAASSATTDYAGQVARLLNEGGHAVAGSKAFNIAVFEKKPKEVKPGAEIVSAGRAADLLVVALGDNAGGPQLADFAAAYEKLLSQAKPAKGSLVCLSTWWQSKDTDAVIKPACERAGGLFVDIGDIHAKPGTTGATTPGATDPGVRRHPGDAGMAEMASRIVSAWQSQNSQR